MIKGFAKGIATHECKAHMHTHMHAKHAHDRRSGDIPLEIWTPENEFESNFDLYLFNPMKYSYKAIHNP